MEQINPNAQKMCQMCNFKDKCDQTPLDLIFCKDDRIAYLLSEIKKIIEIKVK